MTKQEKAWHYITRVGTVVGLATALWAIWGEYTAFKIGVIEAEQKKQAEIARSKEAEVALAKTRQASDEARRRFDRFLVEAQEREQPDGKRDRDPVCEGQEGQQDQEDPEAWRI